MKKNTRVFRMSILCLVLISTGCDSDMDSALNQSDLDRMLNEIVALSVSLNCENAGEWHFTEIGDKPCGGPAGYIAYSTQIDTAAFLDKVETYTTAHEKYNLENEIVSDCAIDPRPLGVKCQEGKPVLIYNACELIPDSGPCEAAMPRYYFDQEEQKCKTFLWGGCEGTVPFETLEECQACE